VKLVHLVGFIVKKFVTMHGHMNVKKNDLSMYHESKLVTFFKIMNHNIRNFYGLGASDSCIHKN
jgi:hypothetical protein